MYTITKEFSFSASHRLSRLPPAHRCSRLHGHNYRVEVILAAEELDETGFVVDFDRLAPVRRYIDDQLDHRHLNDVLGVQPSSEELARHIYDWCQRNLETPVAVCVRAVRVMETASTSATYSPIHELVVAL